MLTAIDDGARCCAAVRVIVGLLRKLPRLDAGRKARSATVPIRPPLIHSPVNAEVTRLSRS